MKAVCAPKAWAEMMAPSMSVWGLAIISGMSLHVPGSASSALTTRYLGLGLSLGMKPHFIPVGNPAPPRPRRPESLTMSMMSSPSMGPSDDKTLRRAWYPPARSYDSRVHERSSAQLALSTGVNFPVSVIVFTLTRIGGGVGLGGEGVGLRGGAIADLGAFHRGVGRRPGGP